MKEPLWDHQDKGRDFILDLWNRKQYGGMLAMDMGTGKSRVALELALCLDAMQLLILCPLRVVDVWGKQIARFADRFQFVGLGDGTVERRTAEARRYAAWSVDRGKPVAICINYDAARVSPFAKWAAARPWDMVIADECVPAGTQIDTPQGRRAIEELRAGDIVLGYDHNRRRVIETPVTNAFRGFNAGPRYRAGSTVLTAGHPVWTREKDYVAACQMKGEKTVAYLVDRALRMVRLRISKIMEATAQNRGAILQPEMLGAVAYVAPGIHQNANASAVPATAGNRPPEHEAAARTARRAGETQGAFSLQQQPRKKPGESPEGDGNPARLRLPAAHRGQWRRANRPTENAARSAARFDYGIPGSHPLQTARAESRPRHSQPQAGNRGGWPEPSDAAREAIGPEESQNPGGSGMAAATLHQPGNPAESLISDSLDSERYRVYNIETGTANYFANGLLVHNSHRFKDPRGATSQWMAKLGLMARRRLALTGTPMPHQPLDVWSQFRFINPYHLERTFGEFKMRYAIMGGYFDKQIVEWRDLDDLERRFRQLAFRVSNDVLDLPPEMDEVRTSVMSERGQKLYAQMERDMIAWVSESSFVTAANAMVKLLRLQQMTSGWAPDESGTLKAIDAEKERLLKDVLDDLREPVVVFCRFKSDLEAVHRASECAGLESAELSGDRDELAHWQGREPGFGLAPIKREGGRIPTGDIPDVLAVQIQAGGVGVDLTRARVAVFYSIGFSLADYLQARARIRRPPQARPCLFIHLQIRDSVDEYVLRAVEARGDLVDSVLQELKTKGAKNVVAK